MSEAEMDNGSGVSGTLYGMGETSPCCDGCVIYFDNSVLILSLEGFTS